MFQRLHGIPIWLRTLGGTILAVLACGILIYVIIGVCVSMLWDSSGRRQVDPQVFASPSPCVGGEPGSPAIFANVGIQIFIFPESASNIESSCLVWQTASINVWFEMDASDLDPFIDSMRWDVRPLTSTSEPPTFGNPQRNATYLFGNYSEYPEGASVWIDTSSTRYRVFVYAWFD